MPDDSQLLDIKDYPLYREDLKIKDPDEYFSDELKEGEKNPNGLFFTDPEFINSQTIANSFPIYAPRANITNGEVADFLKSTYIKKVKSVNDIVNSKDNYLWTRSIWVSTRLSGEATPRLDDDYRPVVKYKLITPSLFVLKYKTFTMNVDAYRKFTNGYIDFKISMPNWDKETLFAYDGRVIKRGEIVSEICRVKVNGIKVELADPLCFFSIDLDDAIKLLLPYVMFKYYPKNDGTYKDTAPDLPGPNTATITGIAPTPTKADALSAAADSAKSAASNATSGISSAASNMSNEASSAVSSAKSAVSSGVTNTTPPTLPSTNIGSSVSSATSGMSGAIGGLAGAAGKSLGVGGSAALGGVIGGAAGALSGTGIVSGIAGGAAGGAVGGLISSKIGGIGGGIVGALGGALVGNAVSGLASKLGKKWSPKHFSPSAPVKSSVDSVTGKISSLGGKISSINVSPPDVSNATSGLSSAASSATSGLSGAASSATSGLSSAASSATSGLSGAASGAASGLSSAASSATSGLSGAASGAASSAKGIMAGAKGHLNNQLNTIKSGTNRLKTVKLPKAPTADDINSKFDNIV